MKINQLRGVVIIQQSVDPNQKTIAKDLRYGVHLKSVNIYLKLDKIKLYKLIIILDQLLSLVI